jgi:hypothetical protein
MDNTIVETVEAPVSDIKMKVITISKRQLKEAGVKMGEMLALDNIGQYGYTNDVIEGLVALDIFPDVFSINGKLYVGKSDLFAGVTVLMRSAIDAHKAEMMLEDYKKHILENAKPLSELVESEALDSTEV